VDTANDDLGRAIDINNNPIDIVVDAAVDGRIKKHFNKSKDQKRKVLFVR